MVSSLEEVIGYNRLVDASYAACTLRFQGKGFAGSGLLLSDDGLFLTADHIAFSAGYANGGVELLGDRAFSGGESYVFGLEKFLFRSRTYDVALGRCVIPQAVRDNLDKYVLPSISFSQDVLEGEPVRTYASLDDGVESVDGVVGVSSRFPDVHASFVSAGGVRSSVYRAHASLAFSSCDVREGFSGGPVVSRASGRLLGLTVGKTASDFPHGFVRVEYVKKLLSSYLEK